MENVFRKIKARFVKKRALRPKRSKSEKIVHAVFFTVMLLWCAAIVYVYLYGFNASLKESGRVFVQDPNSFASELNFGNYVKAFKYIWDEIKINIPLDADVYKVKKELYKIIKRNSAVRNIPNKMESEVNDASTDYRIYFNNLDPIIYIEIVDSHIELYLRFLVHPKKKRTVENSIWLDILKSNNEGRIELYKKE